MAISSSGGGTVTNNGGVVQAGAGQDAVLPAGGSATVNDTPESQAELEAAQKALAGEEAVTEGVQQDEKLAGIDDNQVGKEASEETVYKTMEEVPAERIEAIKTNLKEAGGIYADPRYETAALEFESLGTVSDATKQATAEAFGVPVEAVQQFIDGQIAQRQLAKASAAPAGPTAEQIAIGAEINKAFPGATTEADYTAFMAWGKDNLSPAEVKAYDAAMDRGDATTVAALLGAFKGRYTAAGNGPGPRDITQEANSAQGQAPAVQGYANSDQMTTDMANPKYRTDEAFRKEVEAKVAASRF